MALRFKAGTSVRLVRELEQADPRLSALVYMVAGFVRHHFDKDIVITEVFRTQAQQVAYYPGRPYRPSVHQFGRGVDIGVRAYGEQEMDMFPYKHRVSYPGLTPGEVETIDDWLSGLVSYDDVRGGDSLIHHNVGLGDHLHLQVSWRKRTSLETDTPLLRRAKQRLGLPVFLGR